MLVARAGRRTFASLAVPNYRLYIGGQVVSLVGTWMQSVAQSWLVLVLTHSGTMLGLVVAAQFLPVLLLATYGGVVADRVDKRAFLVLTQTAFGVQALVLGLLTVSHHVQLWMVFALALGFGVTQAFDNPARQAFVLEIVGPALVRNAVTLNSVTVNVARAVGPSVAGLLIASVGVGVCFLLNAASYVAVIVALVLLRAEALHRGAPAHRARGQLREGLHYVVSTPGLLIPLAMMGLVGTLAYEFQVVLPLVATTTFHGDARAYGFMTSAMGAGAIVGGLVVAARSGTGIRPVTTASAAFGVCILAAALAPSLGVELAVLPLVGAASVAFLSGGNSTLQLTSAANYRGRVMALWAIAFLGSTPVGGPIIGAIAEHVGPRAGLAVGGVSCLVAAAIGVVAMLRGAPARAG